MGTTPPPPAIKQHKSRRKISLPWFRQSSVTVPHAGLSRQHTIDTPSSFHARLLKTSRTRQVKRCDSRLHRCTARAPTAPRARAQHPPTRPRPRPRPLQQLHRQSRPRNTITCTYIESTIEPAKIAFITIIISYQDK
ncbi:hypothetical protein O0L34_g2800 [Tuta absoluta]|nr:hypothetical protein O0L34_g2800 [Tuta absoluta]